MARSAAAAIKSERTGVTYQIRPIRSDGFLVFLIVSTFLVGLLLFLATPGISINGTRIGFDILPYFPTMAIVGGIVLVVTGISVYGILRLNKRDKLIRLINQIAEDSPGDNKVKISYLDDFSEIVNTDTIADEFPMLKKDLEITAKVDAFKERMNKLDMFLYTEEGRAGTSELDKQERIALKNKINTQFDALSQETVGYPGFQMDLLKAKKSIGRIKKRLAPQASKRTPRTPPKLPLREADLPSGEQTKFKLTIDKLVTQTQISQGVARKAERIKAQEKFRRSAENAARRAGDQGTIRYDEGGALVYTTRRKGDRESLSREPIRLKGTNMVARKPPKPGFNFRVER